MNEKRGWILPALMAAGTAYGIYEDYNRRKKQEQLQAAIKPKFGQIGGSLSMSGVRGLAPRSPSMGGPAAPMQTAGMPAGGGYMPQTQVQTAEAIKVLDTFHERALAFDYGVEQFCKAAGFDDDDTKLMLALIKEAAKPWQFGREMRALGGKPVIKYLGETQGVPLAHLANRAVLNERAARVNQLMNAPPPTVKPPPTAAEPTKQVPPSAAVAPTVGAAGSVGALGQQVGGATKPPLEAAIREGAKKFPSPIALPGKGELERRAISGEAAKARKPAAAGKEAVKPTAPAAGVAPEVPIIAPPVSRGILREEISPAVRPGPNPPGKGFLTPGEEPIGTVSRTHTTPAKPTDPTGAREVPVTSPAAGAAEAAAAATERARAMGRPAVQVGPTPSPEKPGKGGGAAAKPATEAEAPAGGITPKGIKRLRRAHDRNMGRKRSLELVERERMRTGGRGAGTAAATTTAGGTPATTPGGGTPATTTAGGTPATTPGGGTPATPPVETAGTAAGGGAPAGAGQQATAPADRSWMAIPALGVGGVLGHQYLTESGLYNVFDDPDVKAAKKQRLLESLGVPRPGAKGGEGTTAQFDKDWKARDAAATRELAKRIGVLGESPEAVRLAMSYGYGGPGQVATEQDLWNRAKQQNILSLMRQERLANPDEIAAIIEQQLSANRRGSPFRSGAGGM